MPHLRLPRLTFLLGLFACLLAILFHQRPQTTFAQQGFLPALQPPILYAWRSQTFGNPGQSGQPGRDGRNGAQGQDVDLRLTGQPVTHNAEGKQGEDGSDGLTGDNAQYCNHPDGTAHDLQGADGGSGGSGGHGGSGGTGGNIRVFYSNSVQLQQLTLNNAGGLGGRAGRGAPGGYGCGCNKQTWQVNTCEWQRWRKQRGVANAPWSADGTQQTTCTGVQSYDLQHHCPPLPPDSESWAYRWEYGGVYKTDQYQCRVGRNGAAGQDGKEGTPGTYGKVTLIPRADIPQEQAVYYASLKTLLGNPVDLVKNLWVEKSGLRSQLNPSSKVADTYTYLDSTARFSYRMDWKAPTSPEQMNVSALQAGAGIKVEQGKAALEIELPGTLEYNRQQVGALNVVTITGGFDPARVKAVRIEEANANQLVLVDTGEVRSLLQGTRIKVTCLTKQSASGLISEMYQKRHSQDFFIPPLGRPSDGAVVTDHTYRFSLKPFFSVWLKSGNDVQYQIEVQQTTKSGVIYRQNEAVSFQVPV
jgi:hypothetical protein